MKREIANCEQHEKYESSCFGCVLAESDSLEVQLEKEREKLAGLEDAYGQLKVAYELEQKQVVAKVGKEQV